MVACTGYWNGTGPSASPPKEPLRQADSPAPARPAYVRGDLAARRSGIPRPPRAPPRRTRARRMLVMPSVSLSVPDQLEDLVQRDRVETDEGSS